MRTQLQIVKLANFHRPFQNSATRRSFPRWPPSGVYQTPNSNPNPNPNLSSIPNPSSGYLPYGSPPPHPNHHPNSHPHYPPRPVVDPPRSPQFYPPLPRHSPFPSRPDPGHIPRPSHPNPSPSPSRPTRHEASRKKDEEKKLRRAGILPAFAKPKPKPGAIVISKAAQEKKALKAAAATAAATQKPKPNHTPGARQLAIGSVMTVAQLAHLMGQKLREFSTLSAVWYGSGDTSADRVPDVRSDRLQALMQAAGLTDIRPDRILTTDDAAYLALESGHEPIVDNALAFDIYPSPPPAVLPPLRPPVVCIMGHVDHGKTTLLDALRSSSVAAGEAGGITQHIGAFEVALTDLVGLGAGEGSITFLDTPGHAAFGAMRSRGAMATDVAVVVVAADDGVKPQTEEVIGLVRDSGVGIVVAITKCDKPGLDLHRTKAGIYSAGLEIESLGGEVPCVEVSAVTRRGLGELAETIIAVAEVRELRAEVDGVRFEGRVIESDVGRERGNAATIIALRGTLVAGMHLVAGCSYGRARQLISVSGQPVATVRPGQPVQVTGWKTLPEAGAQVLAADCEEDAKRACENRLRRLEAHKLVEEIEAVNEKRAQAKELFNSQKSELVGLDRRARWAHLHERDKLAMAAGARARGAEEADAEHELRIVAKADFMGTVEALTAALAGLGNETVRVKIVSSGVGNVTESDVGMAVAARAMIVGFNVSVDRAASVPMATHNVECKTESVIYRLVDHITARLVSMLPKRFEERIVGEATIAEVFEITIKGRVTKKVAGCKVTNGEIKKKDSVRVTREMETIWEGRLEQLKHGKKDEQSISKGRECGMAFDGGFDGFRVGDKVMGLEKYEVARTLNDGL